jgi:hypothetical protein
MTAQSLARLIAALEEIQGIMLAESYEGASPGLQSIVSKLRICQEHPEAVDELIPACQETYMVLLRIPNGYDDFTVWRDDFDERVEANIPLDSLKAEVKALLLAGAD